MLYDIKETSIQDIFVLFSNSEILMINELQHTVGIYVVVVILIKFVESIV